MLNPAKESLNIFIKCCNKVGKIRKRGTRGSLSYFGGDS